MAIKSKCFLCITCDVEVEQEEDMSLIRQILQMYRRYNLKGTFFLLLTPQNYPIWENSDIFSLFDNHELGLHIHWGETNKPETSRNKGLKSISLNRLRSEIEQALEYSRKLGFKPTSFRSGGLCQTTLALTLIKSYGFQVDSSVAPKLNEKNAWFQKHVRVPYRSWYFPSKKGYDVPATSFEDRIEVLEIPITRLIPSFNSWFPYTLEPTTPLFKVIINQCLFRSRWENPLLVTPIIHSWGESLDRSNFNRFLMRLHRLINYTKRKIFDSITFNEANHIIAMLRNGE